MYDDKARNFYDNTYHGGEESTNPIASRHYKWLFNLLRVKKHQTILDVGCGRGDLLIYASDHERLKTHGIDISSTAIKICKQKLPSGVFICGRADKANLPFKSETFDIVASLGSLEHFEDIEQATSEIYRVTKPGGKIVISVPNAKFLGRTLRLFKGTAQKEVKETVKKVGEWTELFTNRGFVLKKVKKDLHMINLSWIKRCGMALIPLRFLILLALICLPNQLQYQNYYFLEKPTN